MVSLLHRRSCFVVAPTGTPVGPFLEILRLHRFEPFFISDFLTSGNKLTSKVRTAFRSIDFVIGLLVADRPLESTFFELGIASGLAKPTIIFADLNARIEDVFGGIDIRRVDLSNLTGLIPDIENFLTPKPTFPDFRPVYDRSYENRAVKPPRPRREQLQLALNALRDAQSSAGAISASRLESEIARTFASAGMTAVQAPPSRKPNVPDLALWIDNVQKEIGNPIAVEVKGALTEPTLTRISSQLSASLESIGATAGIIVHQGPSLNQPHHLVQASPLIFIFSLDELTQLLEAGTFASVLKRSHNAAINRIS